MYLLGRMVPTARSPTQAAAAAEGSPRQPSPTAATVARGQQRALLFPARPLLAEPLASRVARHRAKDRSRDCLASPVRAAERHP